MNRSTKALARAGSLAVIAGTVLSTPFALGTANATVTAVTVHNGRVTSNEVAANLDWYTNDGVVQWTGSHATTITISGAGAFLPSTANQAADTTIAAGNVTVSSTTTASCPTGACTAHIGDTQAGAVTVAIVDGTDGTNDVETVNFNGLFNSGCPQTGLDADTIVGGDFSGGIADTDFSTPTNCVTQGQYGTPLTMTTHYGAGGSGGAGQNLVVFPDFGFANAQWSGGNTSTCTYTSPTVATCTTDASGNVTYTVADVGSGSPPPAEAITMLACTNGSTGAYPNLGAHNPATTTPVASYPLDHRCSERTINFSSNPIATTRLDLTSAQMIAPNKQNASATNAEPGDAVQLKYHVSGGCTPVSPALTCTGPALSGVSLPLSVDHGFFTPNCETSQSDDPTSMPLNGYGACSFATAPAAGGVVGNLTNSGTTKTVTTNIAGDFVVTIGIGRDSAFDSSGAVIAHITSGSIAPLIPGDRSAACSSGTADNVVSPVALPGTATDLGACPADIRWVTSEQPLNGGSAKYSIVAPLASPNNTSIDTENNYTASDSGTSNVPDTSRVVFSVNATDQFGNLVQFTAGSNPITLTKTGPGGVAVCTGSSSVDACTGAPKAGAGGYSAQADGTYKETDAAVAGTYQNLPTSGLVGPTIRYQADVNSQSGSSYNGGYSTGTPGAIDGTQTDVLSWAAPTTTFASIIAPGIVNFAAGSAAAATDTLTLNFYNQLSQPVVTFTVTPGNTVPTSTAVTVTAKEVDQFGNPIVAAPIGTTSGTNGGVGAITVVRSGSNESSCVPAQITANGGAGALLFTNTSGIAGYTFSCNSPGVSTVSMVVTGPGGTQLASGKEAITFTGVSQNTTVERPTLSLSSAHKHHLTVHVSTSPALGAGHRVVIYRLVNGIGHPVGQMYTGPGGNAGLTFSGLRSGATWILVVRVLDLGSQYRSEYSTIVRHRVK